MQPDVFLFLPELPEAGAKCVAQVLGALLPGFSSTALASSRGRCSSSPAWVRTFGHLQAAPRTGGKSERNSRAGLTRRRGHKDIQLAQVSSEALPPLILEETSRGEE